MTQILSQNLEIVLAAALAFLMLLLPKKQSKSSGLKPNLLDSISNNLFTTFPVAYQSWLEKQLTYADWRSTAAQARLCSFKLYPLLGSIFLLYFLHPAIVSAIALVIFFVPDLVIYARAKRRQAEILSALPQAIDLMLLGVDAGLSLDATMQRISSDRSYIANALNNELMRLGRDILLGVERESAYQDLYRRTGVEELKSFAAALNQSSKMGLSVSNILRAQSQFMRLRQSQKAEAKAARLPIWMAFPLWFCIMPSLLLILLGPSLLLFFQNVAPMK